MKNKLIIFIITLGIFLLAWPAIGFAQGDIVKITGDIEIAKNKVVNGDIVAMTGNIKIAGIVNGNVTAFKGDIFLEKAAQVNGDVVAFTGKIHEASDVQISGKVTEIKNGGIKVITDKSYDVHPEIRNINGGGNWGTMVLQILGLAAITLIGLSFFNISINQMNLWLQKNTGSVFVKGFLGWPAMVVFV